MEFLGTMRTILREEGVRGLYKGLGTTMLALGPNWAVYFFSYETVKSIALQNGMKEGNLLYVTSSIISAAITDVTTCPLWFIKTRLQTQRMNSPVVKYHSTYHAAVRIMREEGPRAFWQGLTPQLFGVVHVAIQFPLYEQLKKYQNNDRKPSTVQIMFASSISKTAASLVAYPHEILRSRLQFQHQSDPNRYRGLGDAILRIFKEEGVSGFYRGMTANLLRVIPSSVITFTAYEFLVNLF
eukprot:TRINITY_DN3066_c0_g1_i8.p1 TRINITY_DN3066_c0_g1~~TRINITY_DN3066_c0_g1_i8.p1  ORF type:complete len:240 (-),score=40.70 TRINITY_DN3066_c0_g1_i8:94-813(-)